MQINDLKYLVTIAEEKSITKSAEKLFVAQPSLSLCIQRVEKELNLKLFNRRGNGMYLTNDGEYVIAYARRVLSEYRNLEKIQKDLHIMNYGKLSLGVTQYLAPKIVPMVLKRFSDDYPGITVEITESNSEDLEGKLVSGELEVAFLHIPISNENLDYFVYKDDSYVLLLRKSFSRRYLAYRSEKDGKMHLNVKYIVQEPIARLTTGGKSGSLYKKIFDAAGIEPNIVYETRTWATLFELVKVDYCSAIIPEHYLWGENTYSSYGEYYVIDVDGFTDNDYKFVVAHKDSSYLSVATKKFIQMCKDGEFNI